MKLRKLGALFLSLALTLSLCAVPAAAAKSDFEIRGGVLTRYTGSGRAVTIPNSVTKIGEDAFRNCTALKSVTIPSSVTEIGDDAFSYCHGLKSVTIPNGVTKIGDGAFSSCLGLESVTIPNSVTTIGDWALSYCTALTAVTIPNSVTKIGIRAFSYCSRLKSVTIPNSVTEIGGNAFDDTPWLRSLGEFATVNHILLKYQGAGGAVTIPNSVTTIGDGAFWDCTALTAVTIPSSVTTIGENAFRNCTGLKSITIPNSVTEIGGSAFRYCADLTSITIPDSVTTIGELALDDTPWLKSLGEFATVNHILLKYQGAGGAVTIPNSVTTIGDCAFWNCTNLTSVTIPNSVTKIGSRAFERCDRLNSVTIPNSVTIIGDDAFQYCPNLTIHGVPGSYAQKFAKTADIPFLGDRLPAPIPTATAAPQTVLVDGKEVQFTAYALKDAAGNMTNYFKVRDVASVLNGTAAQFAVTWDGAVNLNAKTAYTPNGSEMTTPYTGDQPYGADKSAVKVNGTTAKIGGIVLTDAKGNGYTYYKLRDLGEKLGFQVDWNGKNITISTAP